VQAGAGEFARRGLRDRVGHDHDRRAEGVFRGGAGEDGGGVLRRGDGEEQEGIGCDARVFA